MAKQKPNRAKICKWLKHYTAKYHLNKIELVFRKNRRSCAKRYSNGKRQIILAISWETISEQAQFADFLHEITHHIDHFYVGQFSHSERFQQTEKKLLAEHEMIPKNYTRQGYFYKLETIYGVIVYDWSIMHLHELI